jgi:O-antigen ligase
VAAVGLISATFFLIVRRDPLPRLHPGATALLSGFLALAALQVLPLPLPVVAVLSPARAELSRAALEVVSPAPAALTLSVVPFSSLQHVLLLAALVLVFLVSRELALHFGRTWIPVWPLLALAAFQGALGLYQAYAEGGDGFARGTFNSRDHYAGFLELVIPFAAVYPLAILQRERHRHHAPMAPALKACASLAVAAVILVGIVHSLSRMAFLATLASLFVAAAIAITLRRSRVWLPVTLVGAAVVLGFIYLPTDPLISRFAELARTDDISADTRAQIWRDSAALVRAFPLFGCGLGGYESAFLRYKTVAPMHTVDFAHNDYLQLLTEMGIPGVAVAIALVILVLYAAARGAIYAASPDERMLFIACIASLTAILLHSFVDFNLYVPANSYTVAWICGVAATRLSAHR